MPGKYEAIAMDKLKTKPRYTKINETLKRFTKDERDNKPSPLHYDVARAYESSQWKKQSKISSFGSSKRKSIFAEIASRNRGPGVGAYHDGIDSAYNNPKGMSKSPSLKMIRH